MKLDSRNFKLPIVKFRNCWPESQQKFLVFIKFNSRNVLLKIDSISLGLKGGETQPLGNGFL